MARRTTTAPRWLIPAVFLVLTTAAFAADQAAVREAMLELSHAGKDAAGEYATFRRGAPAERSEWSQLASLYRAVGKVGTAAVKVKTLSQDIESLDVGRREFRQRLARVDSLASVARDLATSTWDAGLPTDDDDEARSIVSRRARTAKRLADQLVIAGDDVAYAVRVTEGIGAESLALSVVGILVVFVVLALIAIVVGSIRKLDDGWQRKEAEDKVEAFNKEPSIDATTLVLLSAACATVITGRFRVRRVRRLLSPRVRRTPWSAQGRLILQGSHTVSRKN